VCQQRTSTVPKNCGTCGIAVLKSTVKATVLVPYKNGTAVVPWYRATLQGSVATYVRCDEMTT